MSYPLPSSSGGRQSDAACGKPVLGRRGVLELARVYIASSAFNAALDTLDRLALNSWDEEAHLLRAEALLGLGRVPEADRLLGPPLLPQDRRESVEQRVTRWHASDDSGAETSLDPTELQIVRIDGPALRRRSAGRRERLALWRFLIQLRIIHQNGGYRRVLELGRIFFRTQPPPACVAVARIATVIAQSTLALRHPVEAKALLEQILDLYKRLGSAEGIADTLFGIANTQLLDCHWDEADALYQEARFRYEEMGQSDKALACMINLGILRAKRGELAGGRSALMQALTRVCQLGDLRRRLSVQLGLGYVEMRLGDRKSARHWLLASLRLARSRGSLRSRALAFEFLGELYLNEGQLGRARRCLEAGRFIARQLVPEGDLDFEILRRLAELSLREGAIDSARSLALESQRMARRYGDACEVAAADRVLAEVEFAEGRLYDALKRTQSARTMLGRIGESFERTRLEHLAARLERKAGLLPSSREPAEPCGSSFGKTGRGERPERAEAAQLSIVRVGDALRICGGNVSAAARSLGTSRSRLDRFLRRNGMHRPSGGSAA